MGRSDVCVLRKKGTETWLQKAWRLGKVAMVVGLVASGIVLLKKHWWGVCWC